MVDSLQAIHPLVMLSGIVIVVILLEVIHSKNWLSNLRPLSEYPRRTASSTLTSHPKGWNLRSFPRNDSGRRYVVVDCGANRGDVARILGGKLQAIVPDNHWTYSFEPNLYYASFFNNLHRHTHVPKACWIADGSHEYYVATCARGNLKSGTLLKEKALACKLKNKTKVVPTIDVSNWMLQNLKPTDFVLFRLNVEGAEYDVVTRMHATGTLKLVDRVSIEYHSQWMSNRDKSDDEQLNAVLAEHGLMVQSFLSHDDTLLIRT
jgi:FkbM family methyltransferase